MMESQYNSLSFSTLTYIAGRQAQSPPPPPYHLCPSFLNFDHPLQDLA